MKRSPLSAGSPGLPLAYLTPRRNIPSSHNFSAEDAHSSGDEESSDVEEVEDVIGAPSGSDMILESTPDPVSGF